MRLEVTIYMNNFRQNKLSYEICRLGGKCPMLQSMYTLDRRFQILNFYKIARISWVAFHFKEKIVCSRES